MLADSSPSNLQLITKELLSMHHQCDPALTKEFDVSKKLFLISVCMVWSAGHGLLCCFIHEISMVFSLKCHNAAKGKCR